MWRKGEKFSKEHREKLSAWQIGKKHSEETKNKIRAGVLGNKNCLGRKVSAETKRKMGNGRRGKLHSEETKLKMRLVQLREKYSLGKIHSIETRKKISMALLGENSSHWKGGITKSSAKRFKEYNWRIISKKVRERDDNTCQNCGAYGTKLDVHHKTPFYLTCDNSLENLITLCSSCHAKADNEFARNTNFLRINPVVIYGQ